MRRELRLWAEEPMKRVALEGRVLRPLRVRRFHRFGAASILHRPDWIYGPHKIAIGDHVVIHKSAWLSVERPAWGRPGPVLRIGSGVGIRSYCTISAAESVVLEDNVLVAGHASVVDSDHTQGGPSEQVVFNPLVTAPVRIGRGSWIGERCSILRGSDIGAHCVIGANSVVRGYIPDHSVAVGAPARVVGSTRRD